MIGQRGNILFLILLAVVLFAALSYAVTSSTRGGGNDASPEKAQSFAAQIVNDTTLMENTIQRLRMSGGCRDTDISFDTMRNGYQVYNNTTAPMDKHCHVFNPAGGNLSIKTFTLDAVDVCKSGGGAGHCGGGVPIPEVGYYRFTGKFAVARIGTDVNTSGLYDASSVELVMIAPKLKKSVCQALNKAFNVPTTNDEPPSVSGSTFSNAGLFTGEYITQYNSGVIGSPSACVYDSYDNGQYFFYHVLWGR